MINHVPFAESSLSVPLECVIQLHQEKYDVLSNNNRTLVSTGMGPVTLQKLVRMSTLPGILDRGDYQEPTTELIENLLRFPPLPDSVARCCYVTYRMLNHAQGSHLCGDC